VSKLGLKSLRPSVPMLSAPIVRHDPPRLSATARGYNYRWQKVSKQYLDKHPLCVECQHEGHIGAATEVDHRIPHKGDQALFWDESNFQPLCHSHHSKKTARENIFGARRQ
jgi:5-methylcytosine-specific restriction protein A